MAFTSRVRNTKHHQKSHTRRQADNSSSASSYGAQLLLEPISPTTSDSEVLLEPEIADTERQVVRLLHQKRQMTSREEREVLDCNWTLKALNETYEQFRNALPQKQKEYHELVISAHKNAHFPLNRLSAPLLLAKEQQKLIEHQFGVTSGQGVRPQPLQQWTNQTVDSRTDAPPPPPPLHSHLVAIGHHTVPHHAPPPHSYTHSHVRHVMSGNSQNSFVQSLSRDLHNSENNIRPLIVDQRVSSLLQNNSRSQYKANTSHHAPQHVQTPHQAPQHVQTSHHVINSTRAQHVPGMRRESPIRLNPNLSITTTTVNTSTYQTKPAFTSQSVIHSHVSPQQHVRQSVVQNNNHNSVLLSRLKAPLVPSPLMPTTNSNCSHTHHSASVTPLIAVTPPLRHSSSNGLRDAYSDHRSPHPMSAEISCKSGVIIQPIIAENHHQMAPQMPALSHESARNLFPNWSQSERRAETLLNRSQHHMIQKQTFDIPEKRHFPHQTPSHPSPPYRSPPVPPTYAHSTAHSPRMQMAVVVPTSSSPGSNGRPQHSIGGEQWGGGVTTGAQQQTVRQMLEKHKSMNDVITNSTNRRSAGVVIPYTVTQQAPPIPSMRQSMGVVVNGGGVATISPIMEREKREVMGLRQFRMAFDLNGHQMTGSTDRKTKDDNNNRVSNEETIALNLKKKWIQNEIQEDEEVVVVSEIRAKTVNRREECPEEDNYSNSSSDSLRLRISETPPKCDQNLGIIDEKSEEMFERESKESEKEFEKRVQQLIRELCEKRDKREEKSDKKDENYSKSSEKLLESLETNHKYLESESEFVLNLNLIKHRDLVRKPRAYLNAKYPKNDISRAIYAGIATKKAVMDFPSPPPMECRAEPETSAGSPKRRRKCYSLKPKRFGDSGQRGGGVAAEEKEEPNKWAFVLQNIDFCSPLSQRIVGVLPDFQFK